MPPRKKIKIPANGYTTKYVDQKRRKRELWQEVSLEDEVVAHVPTVLLRLVQEYCASDPEQVRAIITRVAVTLIPHFFCPQGGGNVYFNRRLACRSRQEAQQNVERLALANRHKWPEFDRWDWDVLNKLFCQEAMTVVPDQFTVEFSSALAPEMDGISLLSIPWITYRYVEAFPVKRAVVSQSYHKLFLPPTMSRHFPIEGLIWRYLLYTYIEEVLRLLPLRGIYL